MFLGDRKTVSQAPAFTLNAVDQAARLNKFRSEQAESRKITSIPGPAVTSVITPASSQVNPAMTRNTRRTCSNGRRIIKAYRKRLSGGEGGILTRSHPPSSVFSLTCANNRMNTGDSAVSPVLIPSTCSSVWAQFLSKCRHQRHHSKKPSHERPEVERVYELQTGLYKFQFRKILFVSFRIEGHETIRLR